MEAHAPGAVDGIPQKEERFPFWWPKFDSIERARKAARGGSLAFGLVAFGLGLLAWFAVPVLAEGRSTTTTYVAASSIALFAFFVYLTWRAYKRPTVLLNCIAFALAGGDLGLKILLIVAAYSGRPDIAKSPGALGDSLLWPILATVAAIGGICGAIAVRRFGRSAPPPTAAPSAS